MSKLIERYKRNSLKYISKDIPFHLRIAVECAANICNAVNPLKIKRYASR